MGYNTRIKRTHFLPSGPPRLPNGEELPYKFNSRTLILWVTIIIKEAFTTITGKKKKFNMVFISFIGWLKSIGHPSIWQHLGKTHGIVMNRYSHIISPFFFSRAKPNLPCHILGTFLSGVWYMRKTHLLFSKDDESEDAEVDALRFRPQEKH